MLMGGGLRTESFYQRATRSPGGVPLNFAGSARPVPEVNRSVLVEFSPGQMFALVDRVEDYPNFLPWCGGTTLFHRDAGVTRAEIAVNYHGIRQRFTTENAKQEPVEMRI